MTVSLLKAMADGIVIVVGIPIATFLLLLGTKVLQAPKNIYERNRKALLLAKKNNKKITLSEKENDMLLDFLEKKVLEKDDAGFLKLSDKALNEVVA